MKQQNQRGAALIEAVKSGNAKKVESLIKFGIDLNFKDRSDQGVSY
jgi:hypothetical protein